MPECAKTLNDSLLSVRDGNSNEETMFILGCERNVYQDTWNLRDYLSKVNNRVPRRSG